MTIFKGPNDIWTHEVDSKKTLSSPKGIRIQVDIFTSIDFSILTIYVRLSRTKRSPDDKDIEISHLTTYRKQENKKKKPQEPTQRPSVLHNSNRHIFSNLQQHVWW
jgi:hypothetical protein